MQKKILLIILLFQFSAVGCSSDKTTDILKQDIAHLKTQMVDTQKGNTDAEMRVSSIENRLQNFEEKVKDLENQVFNLSAKVEEGIGIEIPAEVEAEKPSPEPEVKELPSTQNTSKEPFSPQPEIKELPPLQPEVKELPPPPKKEEIAKAESKPPEEIKVAVTEEKKGEDELKRLKALLPEELYKNAYDNFVFGEYDKAIVAFKVFLDSQSKSELADNSQYWIGECYYAKKDYKTALSEFQNVIQKYPNGNKVPDAMLKIGYTYYALGDKKSALNELNDLIKKFPKKTVSRLAKEKIKAIEKGK
ncbi:MAG: tol-pal system protein YbgF [Nitrospinae bacterium RIFCSPHIGHO2_02_FULL_39_82]|nr:MAG: tol-pal system protein YbgF [Nitrospinae bacterium RIFCSPHIGHO2_02_39_11]OGW02401.1 MAG: tol-pal system protein YbgF [Nitrospinae bacterium RIFCSPHIGHO2_02_FULL_39_82]